MRRVVRIRGYFSLETDLAAAMRSWPKFRGGAEYDVSLVSPSERVEVTYREESEEDNRHVEVNGEGSGDLFERVLGCVIWAMSQHSDDLLVSHWPEL